ncbi:hypothetical protein [Allorhizobium terrae]|nr:hypothetical protein [Allorhizobium terrae]
MTRTASVVAAERLETCFPGLKAIGRITLTSEKGRADENDNRLFQL